MAGTARSGGVSIRGEGVSFALHDGAGATTRSAVAGSVGDPVGAAIEDAGLGLIDTTTVADLTIDPLPSRGRGTRAADDAPRPALVVDVGLPNPGERRVVLVEEDGAFAWFFDTDPTTGEIRLPIDPPASGARGPRKLLRRIVRVIAVNTVGAVVEKVTGTVVGGWDRRKHPYRLRGWDPDTYRTEHDDRPSDDALRGGPVLLVIHGFTGSIHGSFGSFEADVVKSIHAAYGGRVLAFDHPTLVDSPQDNARKLLELLPDALDVDIVAHSRGGLVARELAALAGSRVRIRSITFVATPNAGTPLADPQRIAGMLDSLTNLVGAVPGGEVLELALELVKDVTLGSTFEALRGWTAMDPDGEVIQRLNASSLPDVALRAICADYEPPTDAGIVRTARDALVDTYFGSVRNDLIVPTLSTIVTDTEFHVPARQRLVLDSSRAVDHSTFWTNPRAVAQLRDWLRPDWPEHPPRDVPAHETEPLAEAALPPDPLTIDRIAARVKDLPAKAKAGLELAIGGPIDPRATPPTGTRGAVVVLPGIMGTHLAVDGRLIWLDPIRLARGGFGRLVLPTSSTPAVPAGLNRTYLPLVTRLAANWDVYLAPYDWRVDIPTSAAAVAAMIREQGIADDAKRAVHFVAHSMGGLVARSLAVVDRALWDELGAKRRGTSGRLVMLGTPNRGSYSIALTLTGNEAILKALAAVDTAHRREELAKVIASFDGVYQMLPAPGFGPDDDQHDDLYQASSWAPDLAIDQARLDRAKAFHEELAEVIDPERLRYVAGVRHDTPYRIQFAEPGQFRIGRWARGDGRVAVELGRLAGVTTYYTETAHGSLPSDPKVLASIDSLLRDAPDVGTELATEEPNLRGAGDAPMMVAAAEFDPEPRRSRGAAAPVDEIGMVLDQGIAPLVGGGGTRTTTTILTLGACHASLEQSRHPVAVGHYAGLPPGGAEGYLDARLRGALRTRHRAGDYPETAGDGTFIPAAPGCRPGGALVLGLGQYGAITVGVVSDAMAKAFAGYVLDFRERGVPLPDPVGVSSVLIGTPGRHGLLVEEAVAALAHGIVLGLERLIASGVEPPTRVHLELVELYEQVAEEAAAALERIDELVPPVPGTAVEIVTQGRLLTRAGGLAGSPPRGSSGPAWVRMLVSLEEDGDDELGRVSFSTLSRGAQTDVFSHEVDRRKVRDFIDESLRDLSAIEGISRTLYEWLFPHRAKLDLERHENLHLILDPEMAKIPWELLSGAAYGGAYGSASEPLALRAGLLRQLQSTDHTRERWIGPTEHDALVIGDPPTGALPRLPHARQEARAVAGLLAERGWVVEDRVYDVDDEPGEAHWSQITAALYRGRYRVVHVAAHGVLDDAGGRTGVVIGPGPHHRITASDFAAMPVTPDLVFLNCCHLGHLGRFLDDHDDEQTRPYRQPHGLAATLAEQLLKNGVRAVVVTGWAVDDLAARAFAATLYTALLDGTTLGAAVSQARRAARDADAGRSATWGAYQCYGDPSFQLVSTGAAAAPKRDFVSAGQLRRAVDAVTARVGASSSTEVLEAQRAELQALEAAGEDQGLLDGDVLEALGRGFGEVGDHGAAIAAYEGALRHHGGDISLDSIGRLVNHRARKALADARSGAIPMPAARTALDAAIRSLVDLEAFAGPTPERASLRGSAHKRWAATTADDADRVRHLGLAEQAYAEAVRLADGRGTPDPYPLNNWLQLAALARRTTGKRGLPAQQAQRLDELLAFVTDPARELVDYWDRSAIGDTYVTHLLTRRQIGGRLVDADAIVARYHDAFAVRVSVREGDSTIEHLNDLAILLDATEPGRVLAEVAEQLIRR